MTDELMRTKKEVTEEIEKMLTNINEARFALSLIDNIDEIERPVILVYTPLISFAVSDFIFPTPEFLNEYIQRLKGYIAILSAEYKAL